MDLPIWFYIKFMKILQQILGNIYENDMNFIEYISRGESEKGLSVYKYRST